MKTTTIIILGLLILSVFTISVLNLKKETTYKFGDVEISKSQLETLKPKQDGEYFNLCDIKNPSNPKCIGLQLWKLDNDDK